jgi:hypothetical protein
MLYSFHLWLLIQKGLAYKTLRYLRYATSVTMSFYNNVDVLNDCSNLMIIYDDDKEEEDDDDDADDDDSDVSIVSTSQCWSFISLSVSHYHAGLVTKFI